MLIESFQQNLASVEIQAALISALGGIVTALITTIAAAIIGRYFMSRRRLKEDLRLAIEDIEFLLHVEQLHHSIHASRGLQNFKLTTRSQARAAGLTWSGRFTPGRIAAQRIADRVKEATHR